VRGLTENDCDFIRHLANKKYPHYYDFISVEAWFRNRVLKEPIKYLAIRTDSAFLIGFIDFLIWLPSQYEFNVGLLCADDGAHWEGVKLLRFSMEWATQRGCAIWRFGSDEDDVPVRSMCLRVGAKEISPRYMKRLTR
jgi:hypothetical protein